MDSSGHRSLALCPYKESASASAHCPFNPLSWEAIHCLAGPDGKQPSRLGGKVAVETAAVMHSVGAGRAVAAVEGRAKAKD